MRQQQQHYKKKGPKLPDSIVEETQQQHGNHAGGDEGGERDRRFSKGAIGKGVKLKRKIVNRKEARKQEKELKKQKKEHHRKLQWEYHNPEKAQELAEKERKKEQKRLAKAEKKVEKEKEMRKQKIEMAKKMGSIVNTLTESEKKDIFLKSIGKTTQDLLDEDDREIAYLEAKLGLNKKKKKKGADSLNDTSVNETLMQGDGLDALFKPLDKKEDEDISSDESELEDDDDEDLEEEEEEEYYGEDGEDGPFEDEEEMEELEDDQELEEEEEMEEEEPYSEDGEEEREYDDDELYADQIGDEDEDADALMDELENALGALDEDDDDEEYDEEDLEGLEDLEGEDGEEDMEDEEEDNSGVEDDQDLDQEEDELEEEFDEEEDQELEEDQEEVEEEVEEEEENTKTKEDIYGRLVDSVTGEIIKDNKGVGSEGAGKYVPPHLRNAQNSSSPSTTSSNSSNSKAGLSQKDINLKRKLNGHLNKLATNNFHVIYNEIQLLFNENPRNTLKTLISESLLQNSSNEDHVIHHIIHANTALVAALHGGIGTDFGGLFIEELFRKYKDAYDNSLSVQCQNYLLVICHLYNFQVIGKILIVDLAKRYVSNFNELDIQLLQLLIQNAGYFLRGDDPGSLKDIIMMVQKRHSQYKDEAGDRLTKINFMLETMTNLKNNKIKDTRLIETLANLRKAVRALLKQTDTSLSSNTMRISLSDLESIETVGRWWLVGASWAGHTQATRLTTNADGIAPINNSNGEMTKNSSKLKSFTDELLKLAEANRMVTDLQKSIFCIVMSSEDYTDAFNKILLMDIKDKHDREVINIVVHCCLKEKKFNPYYFLLINRFCQHNKNFKFTLQYNIWDRFKLLKNQGNSLISVMNLANLLYRLIESGTYSLTILRVVNFESLDPISIVFFRILFTNLLTKPVEEETKSIFEKLSVIQREVTKTKKDNEAYIEGISSLIKGIGVFFIHGLMPSSQPTIKKEMEELELLKSRAKVARRMMKSDSQYNFL